MIDTIVVNTNKRMVLERESRIRRRTRDTTEGQEEDGDERDDANTVPEARGDDDGGDTAGVDAQ